MDGMTRPNPNPRYSLQYTQNNSTFTTPKINPKVQFQLVFKTFVYKNLQTLKPSRSNHVLSVTHPNSKCLHATILSYPSALLKPSCHPSTTVMARLLCVVGRSSARVTIATVLASTVALSSLALSRPVLLMARPSLS
jgi:hypothetical protein